MMDKNSGIDHASELNSKVTSSDSEVAPRSWLDLILRTNGDLGARLTSFCQILLRVSLRSLFTLLYRCRSSLIYWSFLAFTSSMEMYFLRSRQFSWIEMRLISFYFSQSFRSSVWRLVSSKISLWLRSLLSYSLSLLTSISSDLIFSYLLVSIYDSEVHSFFLKSSPFIFLLLLFNYSIYLLRVLFLCCSRSIWFCRCLRLAKLFWFILLYFSDFERTSICSEYLDAVLQVYSSWSLKASSSPCKACLSYLDLPSSYVMVLIFSY